MCTKTPLDRIRELRDANPDLSNLLESRFPEIVDDAPFIGSAGHIAMFMINKKPNNLYGVHIDKGYARIINLMYLKYWKGEVACDGFDPGHGDYITETSFKKLLKISVERFDNINFLLGHDIAKLHKKLFG